MVTAGMVEKISSRMQANSQSNKERCWGSSETSFF
jgi:hypothetical protein